MAALYLPTLPGCLRSEKAGCSKEPGSCPGGSGSRGLGGPFPVPEALLPTVLPAAAAGVRPALEVGEQHRPAVLRADGRACWEAGPALGGQHRFQYGVLLLLQQPREPCRALGGRAGGGVCAHACTVPACA